MRNFIDFTALCNIIRAITCKNLKIGRACSHNDVIRRAFRISTGKPTGKRPLGRSTRRWEDNIRMDLEEKVSMRVIGLIRLRIGIIGEPL